MDRKRKVKDNMQKAEWNVNISEIWYSFSVAVSSEEIDTWKRKLAGKFSGKIRSVQDSSFSDLVLKKSREIFLITDRECCYEAAYQERIPFLLYLHEGNRDAEFSKAPFGVLSLDAVDLVYIESVYKRFYGIPWTILETDRCIIREITEEDLDELYEVYEDPAITRYTEGLYEDREEERKFIRQYIEKVYGFDGFGIWAVILKETGRLIGRAGLAWREGYDTPELGYVIGVPYQRKGIATEVCGAILSYATEELGFSEIRVLFEEENIASLKLCRKLGFKRDKSVMLSDKQMEQYIFAEDKETEKNKNQNAYI